MWRDRLGSNTLLPATAIVVAACVSSSARAAELVYSNDAGSIIRLDRAPDMSVKGTICAPSTGTASCDVYRVKGINTPGTLSLEIEGKDGAAKTAIDYARVPRGTPGGPTGYTEWLSTSPDAPDFLKSFRAPVNTTGKVSDQYLRQWGGRDSKLLDFDAYVRAEAIFETYYREHGYPTNPARTVPLVVARPQAASWEAVAVREGSPKPDITTFSAGIDGAVIATESGVVLTSLQTQSDLSPYLTKTGSVIEMSMIRLRAPVESIFDEYMDIARRNGALGRLNQVLGAGTPTETCLAEVRTDNEFMVACATHTTKYSPRMGKYFISSLFVFMIDAVEQGTRLVRIVQRTAGAQGPLNKEPPSPLEYKVTPENNDDVSYVERDLKAKLRKSLVGNFPTLKME
jgi:hypothetical protein